MSDSQPFWKTKSLIEMSETEWESLCDGCGQCCLHKLQDEETDEVYFTDVACRQLDLKTARCKKYDARKRFVPGCVQLTPETVGELGWLPHTCAYRLVNEGRDLYDWHPLISGTSTVISAAAISVAGRAVDERVAGDLEDHLYDWNSGGK